VAGEAIAQGAPALADRISYSFNRVSEACRRHSLFSNTIISALHSKGDRPLVSVDFTAVGEAIALPDKSPVAIASWCRWTSKRNKRRSHSHINHLRFGDRIRMQ
jgi:hypothetical protein